jgi:putative oxidoreductase
MWWKNPHKHDFAALVLRLGLAAVFLLDGFLKVQYQNGAGWHPIFNPTDQLLVAWGEIIGGIALVLGFLTRLSAFGLGFLMLAAVYVISGSQELYYTQAYVVGGHSVARVSGFEYLLNCALALMCLALVIQGGGKFAVDSCLVGLLKKKFLPSLVPAGRSVPAGF